MIASKVFKFTFRGRPARLRVFRNNGHCWGRINVGKVELDVTTRADQYDKTDADAAAAFIRASKRPTNVEDAVGWHGA